MSRKHILQIPQSVVVPELGRQAKSRMLPLMPSAEQVSAPIEAAKAENKIVKQVGASWEEERARQARADEIERQLAEGQSVISLDPAVIDPSFVQDRMPGDSDGLQKSIREQGQQVPILVRPHPDEPGRYQVAFGHRRLRAIQDLGLQVKAIVRSLTDEELVVAQGQENNERQDLTFIERARFAVRLKDRFPREVIMSSLSVDRTTLSTMLQILEGISDGLVDAIGAAPGIGRPSWRQLADLLEKATDVAAVIEFGMSGPIQALPSDDRFRAVMRHLKPNREIRGASTVLAAPSGDRLGELKNTRMSLELKVDKRAVPEFAAFIVEQLPALFAEHQAKNQRKTGE